MLRLRFRSPRSNKASLAALVVRLVAVGGLAWGPLRPGSVPSLPIAPALSVTIAGPVSTVPVGGDPNGIVYDSGRGGAIVSNANSGDVSVIPVAGGLLSGGGAASTSPGAAGYVVAGVLRAGLGIMIGIVIDPQLRGRPPQVPGQNRGPALPPGPAP